VRTITVTCIRGVNHEVETGDSDAEEQRWKQMTPLMPFCLMCGDDMPPPGDSAQPTEG
jgi:hypothetical protein